MYTQAQIELTLKREELRTAEAAIYALDIRRDMAQSKRRIRASQRRIAQLHLERLAWYEMALA